MRRGSYNNNNSNNFVEPRDMLNVGNDIVPDGRVAKRKGKCPNCGTLTHKVGVLGKKTPLTVEGLVLKGRCLQCHPLEGYNRRPTPTQNNVVPGSPQGGRSHQQQQHRQSIPDAIPSPPRQYPSSAQQMYPPEAAPRQQYDPAAPSYRQTPIQQQLSRHPPITGMPPQQQPSYPQHLGQQSQPHHLHHPYLSYPPNGYHPAAAIYQQHYPAFDSMLPPSGIPVPRTLEVADDASVVSQITLDIRFFDDQEMPPAAARRPGPDDEDGRPRMGHQYHRPSRPHPSHHNTVRHDQPVIQEEEEYDATPTTTTPLGLDPSAAAAGIIGANSWDQEADIDKMLRGGSGVGNSSARSSRTSKNNNGSSGEIVFQPQDIVMDTPLVAAGPEVNSRLPPQIFPMLDPGGPSMMDESSKHIDALDPPMLRQANSSSGQYYRESRTINSSTPPLRERESRGRADSGRILDPNGDLDDEQESPICKPRASSKRRSKKREPRGMAARAAERAVDPTPSEEPEISNTPDDAAIGGNTPASPKTPKKKKQPKTKKSEKKKIKQQKQDMHDIPAIMHCLSLDECDSHMREKALESLAAILWRSSEKGREFIRNHKGVETLTTAMWADMESPKVQAAAMHLILAMASSPDGLADSDMLSKEELICDSVLFTMQNHARVPEIQLRGCLIFACLAEASSDNPTITDGSVVNAVQMVLNAMDIHHKDSAIQNAGIRALYHQCLASVHAEGNKRTLMESKLDSGVIGMEVVLRAMEKLQEDHVAMEWACRICWSLTSSEDLVKSSADIPLPEAIVPICMQHIANPGAAALVEAALGAIGNLAHLERMHQALVDLGVVSMIIQGLQLFPNDFGITYEAVAAIANLSFSSFAREMLIQSGAVQLTVASLDHFLDIHAYAEEGLRALVCLLIGSSEAKSLLTSTDAIVKIIADASERHETLAIQQLCCSLVATLSVDAAACDLLVGRGAVGLILNAMESFSELKVQEAGCAALRNMFFHTLLTDKLLEGGDSEKVIVAAMTKHKNSVGIQTNACCALWNMIYKSEDSTKVVTQEGVKSIIKAMQSHMECGELVEQACGALWTIVHDSMDRKKDVVGNGAIDAVTCAIVMHPDAPETLEKACGVLSNVSSEALLAEAIANAQGVTIVAEALRNNPSHLSLLEVGCLTLRNIVYMIPETSSEACAVIAAVVNAMEDNLDAVGFQKEACNLLWILASEDESCQSKILGLDGLTVLMKCLEENRDDSELQNAALGAFNKLSFSGHEGED